MKGMRTGKCPECGEKKEITDSGAINVMCDDCYTKKYTCVVCGEMVTDAWKLYHDTEKGSGHDTCLKPQAIDPTESPSAAAAEGEV